MRVLLVNGEQGSNMRLSSSLLARDSDVQAVGLARALPLIAQWRPAVVVAWVGAGDAAVTNVVTLRAGTDAALVAVVREAEFLDCVEIYDAGADDCLVEPVPVDRLVDSVVALAAAHATSAADRQPPGGDTFMLEDGGGPDRVNDGRRRPARLLPIERRILDALSRRAGGPVTRQQLLYDVWGPGRSGEESYLRLYLNLLRRKLEQTQSDERRIITEVGDQYRLRP